MDSSCGPNTSFRSTDTVFDPLSPTVEGHVVVFVTPPGTNVEAMRQYGNHTSGDRSVASDTEHGPRPFSPTNMQVRKVLSSTSEPSDHHRLT